MARSADPQAGLGSFAYGVTGFLFHDDNVVDVNFWDFYRNTSFFVNPIDIGFLRHDGYGFGGSFPSDAEGDFFYRREFLNDDPLGVEGLACAAVDEIDQVFVALLTQDDFKAGRSRYRYGPGNIHTVNQITDKGPQEGIVAEEIIFENRAVDGGNRAFSEGAVGDNGLAGLVFLRFLFGKAVGPNHGPLGGNDGSPGAGDPDGFVFRGQIRRLINLLTGIIDAGEGRSFFGHMFSGHKDPAAGESVLFESGYQGLIEMRLFRNDDQFVIRQAIRYLILGQDIRRIVGFQKGVQGTFEG